MRGFLRLLGRLLTSLALGLGWLAFLLVAGLWTAERTGLLRDFVLEAVRGQAGTLAADISIESARLAWFEPALELEGLALGRSGEYAMLRKVRVQFAFESGRGVFVDRIDASDGHLRIAPALATALEGFSHGLSPAPETAPLGREVPAGFRLTLRDLGLDWETKRWGPLPIGRVDVDLVFDSARGAEIDGRLWPYLAPLHGGGDPSESGEITLRGRPSGPLAFEIEAWAQRVPLSTASIPPGTVLDALVPWNPRGLLALELSAQFSLDGSVPTRASARARMSEGSFILPRATAPIEGLEIALETQYAPVSDDEAWSPRAWTGRGLVQARWGAGDLRAWSVIGGEAGGGLFAKLWLAASELGLDTRIAELMGPEGRPRQLWNAFEPRGSVDAVAAIAVPSTWSAGDGILSAARTTLLATPEGRAGITYHGWPNLPNGASDQGFPLPIDGVRGEVGYALDPQALRRFRIGIFDLAGEHGSGPISARGFVQAHALDAPPTLPGHGESEIDLTLASPVLAVDARLERALLGLRGAVPPASSWKPFFHPDGELLTGKVAVDLRLKRQVDMGWLATDLTLGLDALELQWAELPVPATEVRGTLRFVSDGRLQRELGVSARGRLGTARELSIALRTGIDPTRAALASGRDLDELQVVVVDLGGLSFTGRDSQVLAAHLPAVGDALRLAAPRGFVDARFERVRDRSGGPVRSRAEVTPAAGKEVLLQFAQFPMSTSDVRGRVLVGLVENPETGATTARTEIAPLLGRWTGDVWVAFTAAFPERVVRVLGAGIDPASSSLRGSIATSVGNATPGSEPDISAIGLSGRVDFGGEIRIPESAAEPAHSRFGIHLRENRFQSGQNFTLDALRGALVLEDGVLRGERLEARLADTPVELARVDFRTTPEGFVFESDLAASGLPIDRRHLLAFADAKTVDALLDDLKWSGKLDVRDGHVTLTGPRTGDTRLLFSGTVVPSEMSIVLGLPLTVRSAEARIEELVFEGGRMRTRARVKALAGLVAGRALEEADMLVTYHEPRLSIEDLTGTFAGGHLQPLGMGSNRGGTLFTIDLVEPYPFQLALDLDAKVEELLQGLFVSNVASKGRLKCSLRLTGDQADLLRMRGSGSVLLTDSYLWSVPVIRTLLEILRLGNTVTFDSMAANLEIQDGKIRMRDIRVASDALQLAGKCTLDFDGTLDGELDVKLSEIANLQWLLRMFSWLTDNIVSVSIRGDLDRPDLSAHWFGIFGKKGGIPALPLPGYAPLPPRF